MLPCVPRRMDNGSPIESPDVGPAIRSVNGDLGPEDAGADAIEVRDEPPASVE